MALVKIFLSLLVIIIFLFIILSTLANTLFNREVAKEVAQFFGNTAKATSRDIIEKEDLEALPECVQKWLESAQVIGKGKINTARLQQKAYLRTTPKGKWMPTEAQQYFRVDEPGFIWQARIKAAPFVHIAGRDKYADGKGHMLIKILSLKSVADARGPEIDQGVLLRFLAETVWFPTAALSSYITWEEINPHSAKATMSYKGVSASGVFTFNEQGDFVSFSAKRYMDSGGKSTLEDWFVIATDYEQLSGVRIPTQGEVTWKLKTGDFTWFKWKITEIEYN